MLTPEGNVLMHADAPYDQAKAHEYYLRTRKLHPRAKGSGSETFTVHEGSGKDVKLSAKQLAEQKAYAAHRTAQIKAKLSKLNHALRIKVEQAKESAAKAAKPPTAAEKAAAAKASKEYAAKHKTKIANSKKAAAAKAAPKKAAKKSETLVELKVSISETKANLKTAVAKQRELATATKNG